VKPYASDKTAPTESSKWYVCHSQQWCDLTVLSAAWAWAEVVTDSKANSPPTSVD